MGGRGGENVNFRGRLGHKKRKKRKRPEGGGRRNGAADAERLTAVCVWPGIKAEAVVSYGHTHE
jgi:hypothetical protein